MQKNTGFQPDFPPAGGHEGFMRLALAEAEAALAAGQFPVGCVIVQQGRVKARGRRVNSTGPAGNELDHAEIVALRALGPPDPGRPEGDLVLYSTMEPCLMCFSTLLLSGIRTVVYGYEDVMGGGADLPLARLRPLYSAMRVTLIPGILRTESLLLCKRFFQDPGNRYWRDSLLARYTLAQS